MSEHVETVFHTYGTAPNRNSMTNAATTEIEAPATVASVRSLHQAGTPRPPVNPACEPRRAEPMPPCAHRVGVAHVGIFL